MSCCPGTGHRNQWRSLLARPDHARQQGLSRQDDQLVAKDLGESEDWLLDVAYEMDLEDGVIWVYGVGDDGVMAFTDFGIENLIDLIKMYKEVLAFAEVLGDK